MRARIGGLAAAALVTVAVTVVAAAPLSSPAPGSPRIAAPGGPSGTSPESTAPTSPPEAPTVAPPAPPPPWHPGSAFAGKILVAYYGTAGTGSMGVLGATSIPVMTARLRSAAAPFAASSRRHVQLVYELIATVADGTPGSDGTYSHDIPRSQVRAYLAAARRNSALLVLDLQPGRSDFLTVAKRYAWALRRPDVGIALDPEWRMGPGEVPGQVRGSVSAAEVNRTAAYVGAIARRYRLPQKVFIIHQFTPGMVRDIAHIRPVKGLAMVQHVDGWGSRADKMATLHNVARHHEFLLGFKLFYREDQDMYTPRQLLHAVPDVRFVSYQ